MTTDTTLPEDNEQREYDYRLGALDAAIEIVAKLEAVFGERSQ